MTARTEAISDVVVLAAMCVQLEKATAALAAEQARAERLAEALRVIAEYQPRLSNTWNQDIDAIRHLARAALALRPSGDGVG